MLSSAEIARGSRGAVKFLSRDVSAPLHFDNTPESCLRSFQVMIVVAPKISGTNGTTASAVVDWTVG